MPKPSRNPKTRALKNQRRRPGSLGNQPDLQDAPRAPMPTNVRPMLATLVDKPFDRAGWVFELKWDGYRAIAEVDKGRVRLYSRNGLSFAERYKPVVAALEKLGHQAVLDGEVVVGGDDGRANFELLQNYGSTKTGRLLYCVFDLLYLDGHDLRGLPLTRRKEILQRILPEVPRCASVSISRKMGKPSLERFPSWDWRA